MNVRSDTNIAIKHWMSKIMDEAERLFPDLGFIALLVDQVERSGNREVRMASNMHPGAARATMEGLVDSNIGDTGEHMPRPN
jgi:hypothetical protein